MNVSIRRTSAFSFLFCITIPFSVYTAAKKPQVEIKTVPQAIHSLNVAIKSMPYVDSSHVSSYEKEYVDTIIKSAKVLYDNARNQILDALSDIDNRIAYWQYQKDHPWNYFVSKNPLKWVAGAKQEEEVENNLDTLKSHQGELYVLLGQLSELGVAFTGGYKDTFLTDYRKGYEWVDSLLDALVRIKAKEQTVSDIPFIARAQKIKAKLDRVTEFKKDLLSDISDTEIPSYIARNWLKAGVALFGLNYGYQTITPEQIANSVSYLQTGTNLIIGPVKEIATDINAPSRGTVGSYEVQANLVKDYVKKMGDRYKLEETVNVIKALEDNNYSLYKQFVEKVGEREALQLSLGSPNKSFAELGNWMENLKDYARGHLLGAELNIALLQKQSAALWKVILSIPAALATGGLYTAYQKLTAKNYGPLRRALVDINSLFIDPSQPLNDEQYGKMLYLVHMLKKRAEKELPLKKNLRADFIADLEKIESSQLSVASKRAVIEDMFKKYSFLGLIQK